MFKGLSKQQSAVGLIIAAVAVVGWIVAFSYQGQIGGLQDALAAAESDKSAAAGQLAEAQEQVARLTEAEMRLGEAELALDEYKAAVGSLDQVKAQLEENMTALDALTPEMEARTEELSALEEKVASLEFKAVAYETFTQGGPLAFQTSSNVNVRTGPSTDSSVLVVLPPGSNVEVFEVVEGGDWYKVGGVGYIYRDLLQPNPEAE